MYIYKYLMISYGRPYPPWGVDEAVRGGHGRMVGRGKWDQYVK